MKRYISFFLAALIVIAVLPAFAQTPTPGVVYVVGEVKSPGQYPYKEGLTVKEVIASAGGATEKADRYLAVILHSDKKTSEVPVNDPVSPSTIMAGDTIVVRPVNNCVRVEGKVKKPGLFDLSSGLTLLQAYALAGGPEDGANLKECGLYRRGKVTQIDLASILDYADAKANLAMQPGDVLYVPGSLVVVTGQVKAPGQYAISEGKEPRLFDMITTAGGFTAFANLKKATLSRLDGPSRKTVVLDLARMDADNNPVLRNGDIIEIPAPDVKPPKTPFFSLTNAQTVALTLYYYTLTKK